MIPGISLSEQIDKAQANSRLTGSPVFHVPMQSLTQNTTTWEGLLGSWIEETAAQGHDSQIQR